MSINNSRPVRVTYYETRGGPPHPKPTAEERSAYLEQIKLTTDRKQLEYLYTSLPPILRADDDFLEQAINRNPMIYEIMRSKRNPLADNIRDLKDIYEQSKFHHRYYHRPPNPAASASMSHPSSRSETHSDTPFDLRSRSISPISRSPLMQPAYARECEEIIQFISSSALPSPRPQSRSISPHTQLSTPPSPLIPLTSTGTSSTSYRKLPTYEEICHELSALVNSAHSLTRSLIPHAPPRCPIIF